jgi:hypothetical protein
VLHHLEIKHQILSEILKRNVQLENKLILHSMNENKLKGGRHFDMYTSHYFNPVNNSESWSWGKN